MIKTAMIKVKILSILTTMAFLACACVPGTEVNVLFQDNFEYSEASPWVLPVNGWNKSNAAGWSIAAGAGVTGNALRFPPANPLSGIINDFSGTDYTVTVQIKIVDMVNGGWPIYLIARATDTQNWYGAGIYEDAAGNAYFTIIKAVAGATSEIASTSFKSGELDTGLFYTLSITVDGNVISGSCTGGSVSRTLNGTAADHASGKPGIIVWTNPGTYDVYFDNFTVTGE